MILYDEDLKQYGNRELVDAYNASVGVVPNAFNKPAVLKNLMLRNLQTRGVKDPYELAAEQNLQKGLSTEEMERRKQRMLELAGIRERTKPRPAPAALNLPSGEGFVGMGLGAAAGLGKGIVGAAVDVVEAKRKQSVKAEEAAAKAAEKAKTEAEKTQTEAEKTQAEKEKELLAPYLAVVETQVKKALKDEHRRTGKAALTPHLGPITRDDLERALGSIGHLGYNSTPQGIAKMYQKWITQPKSMTPEEEKALRVMRLIR